MDYGLKMKLMEKLILQLMGERLIIVDFETAIYLTKILTSKSELIVKKLIFLVIWLKKKT